jgi:hypothetical protein
MNTIIKVDGSTARATSNLAKVRDVWKFRIRNITTSFSTDLGLNLPAGS